MLDRMLGGVLPYLRFEREIHVADGVTYGVDLTWLRRGFRFAYHTPNTPRSIRRLRAAEYERVKASVARRLADGDPA